MLSSSPQGTSVEDPSPTRRGLTTDGNNETRTLHTCDDHDDNGSMDPRQAVGALEEVLLEAGYGTGTALAGSNQHGTAPQLSEADMSLLKTSSSSTSRCELPLQQGQRKRTSSTESFSETSFFAPLQREQMNDQQRSDNRNEASFSSLGNTTDSDEGEDVEGQQDSDRFVRDQFLPAPESSCDEDNEELQETKKLKNRTFSPKEKSYQPQTVPIIEVSNVKILQKKEHPSPLLKLQQRPHNTNDLNHEDDDQHSVSSVQSLISVVAELISLPVRMVYQAVLVNLEHEISLGNCPPRATYLSATILMSRQDQTQHKLNSSTGSIGTANQAATVTPLGLQLDRTSSSCATDNNNNNNNNSDQPFLTIVAIDPDGPWAETPFCVGDRLISVNHVPVVDWDVETFHEYWNRLLQEDEESALSNNNGSGAIVSITIVVHNPLPSADAQRVEAMVTKPEQNRRTGLGMRSTRVGRVKISRVDGLFTDSLLNVGDQILSINGQRLDGCDSAHTAQLILQSPRYVSVVAKKDGRNAFVISSTDKTYSINKKALNSIDNLRLLETADGSAVTETAVDGEAMNRDESATDDQLQRGRRRELDPDETCENCGTLKGPWSALKLLHWLGNLYVLAILIAGLYVVFTQNGGLSSVMGVFFVIVTMANMINVTIRGLEHQKQQHTRDKSLERCSMFQLSCNVIVAASFTLMIMLWKHYDVITSGIIVILSAVVFTPMVVLINLPLLLPRSCLEGEDNSEDNLEDAGEIEAVASLAGSP